MDELIIVRQLPIIEEQLMIISDEVKGKIAKALSLACDDTTLPVVKDTRAELNRQFKDLEERRKAVKQKVAEPYMAFEEKYKIYIANLFNGADKTLKERIDFVENEKKANKRKVIEEHFNEMCLANNIDFLTFLDLGLNITLSASEKSLKEAVDQKLQAVANDLEVINTQEHKDEVLYEYKKSKNLAFAINTVAERHKALDKPEEPKVVKVPVEDKVYTVNLTIHGTRKQMNDLKAFMELNGIKWEGNR